MCQQVVIRGRGKKISYRILRNLKPLFVDGLLSPFVWLVRVKQTGHKEGNLCQIESHIILYTTRGSVFAKKTPTTL